MTAAVAAGLAILAFLDGGFAGFRSSVGRTGLVEHRDADHRAARRGALLVLAMLAPVVAFVCTDVVLHPARIRAYTHAGEAMLAVYAPYATLVLAALGCYAVLGWRQRYLASAVILGPLTLLRPAVAMLGAALSAMISRDAVVAACAVLSAIAVLAVEPCAGRRWYTQPPRS